MGKISREGVRRGLAVLGVLALVLTACDPGKTTAVAGTGASGNTGDGGAATAATLEQPGSIVALPDGSFDVADDTACVIRHVATDGTISTIAGTGTCGYSGDGGPATAAQIDPQSVEIFAATGHLAADTAGNLYLNDSGNTRIRKIDTTGTITTVADGSDGLSSCGGPAGFTVTPDGTVYVGCQGELAKVLPDGTLEEVLAANAMSLASDADGNLYFDDYYTGFIKELDTTGTVTNVTNLTSTLGLDSYGDLPIATDLTIGPDGSLYAALGPTDMVIPNPGFYTPPTVNPADRHVVVRIDAGAPTVIAGTGAADPGTGAQTGYGRELNLDPYGIAIASDGGLLASSGHVVYHLADSGHRQGVEWEHLRPQRHLPGQGPLRCRSPRRQPRLLRPDRRELLRGEPVRREPVPRHLRRNEPHRRRPERRESDRFERQRDRRHADGDARRLDDRRRPVARARNEPGGSGPVERGPDGREPVGGAPVGRQLGGNEPDGCEFHRRHRQPSGRVDRHLLEHHLSGRDGRDQPDDLRRPRLRKLSRASAT